MDKELTYLPDIAIISLDEDTKENFKFIRKNFDGKMQHYLDAGFPISNELRLKRGALVMLVANDSEKRWVNGAMRVVHSLTNYSIKVSIGEIHFGISKTTLTEKEAIYIDGHIEYRDVLAAEQFPLVLAYAITINKSQGMIYKKLACAISQCFAQGQAYVALSRCSSIDGLLLPKPIDSSLVQVEKSVMDFYLSQSTEKTLEKYARE